MFWFDTCNSQATLFYTSEQDIAVWALKEDDASFLKTVHTYLTHGQEQTQPSLSCLPSTCLCFRTSHFTLLSIPVLHRTSTPIVFCLPPPTTTHPVWEQAASLLQFARDSAEKSQCITTYTAVPSSTWQRISHISEIDAYMFLLAALCLRRACRRCDATGMPQSFISCQL